MVKPTLPSPRSTPPVVAERRWLLRHGWVRRTGSAIFGTAIVALVWWSDASLPWWTWPIVAIVVGEVVDWSLSAAFVLLRRIGRRRPGAGGT